MTKEKLENFVNKVENSSVQEKMRLLADFNRDKEFAEEMLVNYPNLLRKCVVSFNQLRNSKCAGCQHIFKEHGNPFEEAQTFCHFRDENISSCWCLKFAIDNLSYIEHQAELLEQTKLMKEVK